MILSLDISQTYPQLTGFTAPNLANKGLISWQSNISKMPLPMYIKSFLFYKNY